MKRYKRLLIVLLSLMMVFTTMPASMGMAFAEDNISEGLVGVEGEIQENGTDPGTADSTTTDNAADQPALSDNSPEDADTEDNTSGDPKVNDDASQNGENTTETTEADALSEAGGNGLDYIQGKEETEALVVQGEAAASEEAASEALVEKGFAEDEAQRLAAALFPELRAGESKGDEEEDVISGGGNSISHLTIQWLQNREPLEDQPLLTVTPTNDGDQVVKARISFGLSGEYNYGPGDIKITIPAYIFKERGSEEYDYGTMVIPFPEDPSTKKDFNWVLDGDHYVITNTKTMDSASSVFFDIAIADLTPHKLVDMEVSADLGAVIEVNVNDTDTLRLHAEPINARFDTRSKVEKVTKRAYGEPVVVDASAIPDELREEGVEKYLKITWYITVLNTANTQYTLDYVDWIPSMEEINASISNSGDQLTEYNDYRGIIIGATAENPQESVKEDVYTGHQTNKLLTYTVQTAYPYEQFEPETNYTFYNKIKFTNEQVDETTDEPTHAETIGSTTWSYADPEHLEPTGHYMIFKNGNDDDGSETSDTHTHKIINTERTTNDLHMWDRDLEGWYGSYPSALNQMQKINREQGEDGQIRLSYTLDSVGYVMPWLFDDESYDVDGVKAPWNIANYSRPVRMITTDYGLLVNRKGEHLKVHDDFEYLEVEFPGEPYVYRGKPNRINEDGSWYAQTADDGTFLYTLDGDQTHWPDMELQVLRNGNWEKYATASWANGEDQNEFMVTYTDGTTSSDRIVKLPEGIDSVRTIVVMQNTATEGTTTQAAISYDIRVVTGLKTTNSFVEKIDLAFENSNAPQFYIYNRCNLTAEYADGAREDDDDPIISLGTEDYNYDDMIQNKDGYNILSGYKSDLQIYPTKESNFKITEVDYESGKAVIHYKASVEERSFIHAKKTYKEAIADGMIEEETSGVWRDLLPAGMTPVLTDPETGETAIKVRAGDTITEVNVIPYYRRSNRTLLEVYVDLENSPTATKVAGSDLPFYSDIITIEFDALLSLEDAASYNYYEIGNSPHNVISFESSNDKIGTIEGFCGEPDDPYSNNNIATREAFKTDEERNLMTNLDPERETPSFVYAGIETNLMELAYANIGLHKDVETNGDGYWSQGVYNGDPSNARTVLVGGSYVYRLRYTPGGDTQSKDIRLYDSLENFYAKTGNDEIDIGAPRWQGTLDRVDTRSLEEMGCAPVVYYSTVSDLQLYEERESGKLVDPVNYHFDDVDDHGNPIWIRADQYSGELSAVKAVAIDCSKDSNGGDFVLDPGETITAYVRMKAPDLDAATGYGFDSHAYNNASYVATLINKASQTPVEDYSEHSDYTKVGIEPYNIEVLKIWDDDDDRDGYRKEYVTVSLYANGEPAEIDPIVLNYRNGWRGTFENVLYSDGEGNRINYTVKETPVLDNYTASVVMSDVTKTNFIITNKHRPEMTEINGMKIWKGDKESTRPSYITVRLFKSVYPYEVETLYKTVSVSPNTVGYWAYSFTNLFKNENGHEIHYRVEESLQGQIQSYIPEYDGFDIINNYHPYGDLTVEKKLVNATETASGKTFTFNFYFTNPADDLPMMTKYNYDIIDIGTDEVVSSGQVEYGSQVTINAEQKIYVHDIDEHVNYEVTEEETPGFTLTNVTGDKGVIVPNKVTEAKFENTYSTKGRLELKARKKLSNKELIKYQFHFEVYKNSVSPENLIRTASSGSEDHVVYNEDGTRTVNYSEADVSFGAITFRGEDDGKEFTYIIKERIPEGAAFNTYKGYTYDPKEYTVRIRVEDAGDGTMNIKYLDENGEETDPPGTAEFLFENKYDAKGGIELRIWKDLKGGKIEPEKFFFNLLDGDGNPLAIDKNGKAIKAGDDYKPVVATNDENGVVTFPEIMYDLTDVDKTYYYAFTEVQGDIESVNYDDSVFGYKVTISDNGDGTLSVDMVKAKPVVTRDTEGNIVSIDWRDEGAELPVFVNTLKPGKLSVTKLIDNPEDADSSQKFHFYVKLIGEGIPEGELEYELSKAGNEQGTETPASKETITESDEEQKEEAIEKEASADQNEEAEEANDQENIDQEESKSEDNIRTAPTEGNGVGAVSHANNRGNIVQRLIGGLFRAITDTAYAEGEERSMDGTAYVVLTDDGELIFFRHDDSTGAYENQTTGTFTDIKGNTYTGKVYAGIETAVFGRDDSRFWFNDRLKIKSVRVADGQKIQPKSTRYWFWFSVNYEPNAQFTKCDLRGIDTSLVTDMSYMFWWCWKLNSLDISEFDTSNVTNMHGMFHKCSSLTSLDLSNFNTAKVTDMSEMFSDCAALTNLNVSSFDTSNVTTMFYMFDSCTSLKKLDVTSFRTGKVRTMQQMFGGVKFETIDLSNFDTSSVTDFGQMFRACSKLKSIDLSNFNTSSATRMPEMFYACSSLTSIDVSSFNTANVETMSSMFDSCSGLTSLTLKFNTENVRYFDSMFYRCSALEALDISTFVVRDDATVTYTNMFGETTKMSKVKLGKGFRFVGKAVLLDPPKEYPYDGYWCKEDFSIEKITAADLKTEFNNNPETYAGTWIWEPAQGYTITFAAEEGATGSMDKVNVEPDKDFTIPANKFYKHKYEFDYWTDGRSRATYADKDTIPANTYAAGDEITLTAHFKQVETTVNIEDGQFDFWLYGGETATFSNLPAGTTYQVWEETPDGWVLIQTENASGVIPPVDAANAIFTNRYQPGVTTAQLFGIKMLDNKAAEDGAFSFRLTEQDENGNERRSITIINGEGKTEEVKLPLVVSNMDGGFISFPVICYDEKQVGTHTYTITEVNNGDNSVDCDTHSETVTVVVTKNEDGTLTSSAPEYDKDGMIFVNKTRPGELRITKDGGDYVTDTNKKDEFTIKVTFHNENGQPIGDDENIDWYKIDADGNIIQGESRGFFEKASDKVSSAWSDVKEWASETWEDIKGVFTEPLVDTAYGAEDERSYDGTAYAVVTAEGELILFRSEETYKNNTEGTFTDIKGNTYTGTVFTGIETNTNSSPIWYSQRNNIIKARIADGQGIKLKTASGVFSYHNNLVECDLRGLNLSEASSMYQMFWQDASLKTVKLNDVDASGVTDMRHVFYNCKALENIDLTGFKTDSATDMSNMFSECRALKELDLSSFNTSNVTSMYAMFASCTSLEKVDISSFDTSKLTNMQWVFRNCESLNSLDLSNFNTSKVTNMAGLFENCKKITELDLSNFKTSTVQDMSGMFAGCHSLTSVELSSFDTSEVLDMSSMFYGCRSIVSLDLSHFNTDKVGSDKQGGMQSMFRECESLQILDISNFDCSRFSSNSNANNSAMFIDRYGSAHDTNSLRMLTVGPKFRLTSFVAGGGINGTNIPPSDDVYTGYWVRIDTDRWHIARFTQGNYSSEMAGTWIWEVRPDRGAVKFVANPGYTTAEDAVITPDSLSVTMPDASTAFYLNNTLKEWNTEPDGSGTSYLPGETYEDVVQLGETVTLYAQWDMSNKRIYVVEHYQQDTRLERYALADKEVFKAEPGTEVTTNAKDYTGFDYLRVEPASTVVVADDNSTVVKYYYNRRTYMVSFDGNGETSGEMAPVRRIWDLQEKLPKNQFMKEGSIFTGWSDGRRTTYTDQQSVKNVSPDGTDITLYAQWLEYPNEPVTPTDGSIIVKLKAGETIVFPNLPDGTTYTVEEFTGTYVDEDGNTHSYMPKGWSYDYTSEGEGMVFANETTESVVHNEYSAEGSVILRARKYMEGRLPEEDEFTFSIYEEGKEDPIQEKIPNNAVADDDDFAWVVFDSISYTEDDIGHTYTYKIVEENGGDKSVTYDSHEETVKVTVSDAGGGILKTEVEYVGHEKDEYPEFVNTETPGSLVIHKFIDGDEIPEDITFEFEIRFYDAEGNELGDDNEFTVIRGFHFPDDPIIIDPVVPIKKGPAKDGDQEEEIEKETIKSGGTITFEAGERIEIIDIPAGVTYVVTEKDKAGWTLFDSENTEGTIAAGVTSEAFFANKYYAETNIVLEAEKTLTGRDLAEGQFRFGVFDDDEYEVASGKNDADGHIVFSPIYYTTADVGKTFFYTVSEVDEFNKGYTYDDIKYYVTVEVTADEDGTLHAAVSESADKKIFTNTYAAEGKLKLRGTKTLEGRDLTASDSFSFVVKEGDKVVSEGTAKGTEAGGNTADISFADITYTQDDAGKEFTYTVTETKGELGGVDYSQETYTVKVKVTDNGDGTLKVETLEGSADPVKLDFTNTYTAAGSLELKGTKTLTGKTLTDGMFTFEVKEGDNVIGTETITNDANGKINYPTISYTLADIGEHEYTVKETSTGGDGIKVDENTYTVKVKVSDNGNGTLKVELLEGSADPEALNFVNKYEANGEIVLSGTKHIDGRALKEGESYEFTLYDSEGKEVYTATSGQNGAYSFEALTYTQADIGKEYEYTVKETSAGGNGITVDTTVYKVTVTVSDAGGGKLDVTAATDKEGVTYDHLDFTNTYAAEGELVLKGTKTLTGKTLTDGMFTFEVREGNTIIGTETITNDANGEIHYPTISYTQADIGEHQYTVRETSTDGNGITVDTTEYTVKVKVSDNGDGTLKVEKLEGSADYENLDFENTYTAAGSLELKGTKTLTGKTLTNGMFTFEVREGNTLIGTCTNAANGTINYPTITYTLDDVGKTHTYTIKETSTGGNGITVDTNTYTVTVKVSDNGDGTLKVELLEGSDDPENLDFENIYNATGEFTPAGTKTINGRDLTVDDKFTFEVTENGKAVSTGTNDASGKINFSTIRYTLDDVGPHTYIVRETSQNGNGITVATNTYTVTVNVSDNGNGTLNVETSSNATALDFENTYGSAGVFTPAGTKSLTGRDLTDDDKFTFEVTENGKVVSTGTNDASGKISFSTINYTLSDIGTHTYIVKETSQSGNGITVADNTYTVTVKVSDNGDGTLKVEAGSNATALDFENTYRAEGSITPAGTKTLTGRTMTADDIFTFEITENGKVVQTATNDASGKINFKEIRYTLDDLGQHNYTIKETSTSANGITVDTTVYTVSVIVTDNGNGTLNISLADGSTDYKALDFENTYGAVGEFIPAGTKTLDGRALTDDDKFTFEVTENGKVVSTGTNDASGKISFSTIQYTLGDIGTHNYVVKETSTNGRGITVATNSYNVTVTVSDNGDGSLKVEASSNATALNFENIYEAEGEVTFEGAKRINGRELNDEDVFTFEVTENGKTIQTVRNDETGKIGFETIKYDLDDVGTHTYTVKETSSDGDGIKVDTNTYDVTVTVSDNGDGTLKVETSDNAKALTFVNTYTAEGEITFSGIKSIDGRKLTANDKFEFTLYDEEGKEIEKAYNDEAGYYHFGTIRYDLTKVGEHVYTVKETSENGSGITVDTTEYKITVTVTDGGKGELNVTAVTDKEGVDTSHLNFTNKYEAFGSVQLEANKSLLGRILREAEFEFELYKDGKLISKANNANDGKIVFDRIDYDLSDAGKSYEYTVKEVPGNVPGVTYDEREFKITVTITDNGDGTLKAEVTTDKKVEFVNPYNADGKLVLEGKKTLKGGKLAGDDFEFTVSENGKVIQTVKNDADGSIGFEEICYTLDDVGTHTYTVKEKAGKKTGMTYDQTEYTIKVEVTDNGDGTLKVEADKTCKALNFTNVYEPPTTPKTGDSTNVMLHAFMLTSSLLALLLLLRKKKTNE